MASEVPLINLCDPIFKTVVTCDTVSSEGYEVSNLLSEDCQKRKNGFLGDRFIKPPVEITLKFSFDTNIRYVVIGAEVGQQKSSGLEIVSSSCPYNSPLCSGSPFPENHKISGLVCSPISERIATVNLNDGEKGVVFFCPLQYGRQLANPVPNTRHGFIQRPMTWRKRSVIAHVVSLTVRIFKTRGSSVPAIGRIEIWGGPSSCMPSTKVSDMMNLWKTVHENKISDALKDDFEKKAPPPTPRSKCDEPLIDVPEEFLDAITWEIMALPMVLPSGKVVDQRTLDLHAQAEANWGRHPSDPFTGIMFSDRCRPVLDSSLKAKIDRFLVLNQDRKDLKTVPRTVGRAHPQICYQSMSRFRNSQVCFRSTDNSRKRSLGDSSAQHDGNSILGGLSKVTQTIQRNLQTNMGDNSAQNFSISTDDRTLSFSGPKKSKLVQSKSSTSTKEDCTDDDDVIFLSNSQTGLNEKAKTLMTFKTHEEKLDDSLDFALKSTLSKLPSFVNLSASNIAVKKCGSCEVSKSLYSLPCSHYLCRPCLVIVSKQTPATCLHCNTEFKSSDPVFHHDGQQ